MAIATTGIGCFRGCGQPVIGQCQGYQDPCGRFYCTTHSVGKLCGDCGERKLKDEEAQKRQELETQAREKILTRYTQLAEELEQEIDKKAKQGRRDIDKAGIPFFLICLGLIALVSWATNSANMAGTLLVISIIIIVIHGTVKTSQNWTALNSYKKERLAEITLEYQEFDEFFPEWKKVKDIKDEAEQREKAKAFNAVVSLLAGTAVDTYKYVEKEVKKDK